MPSQTFWSFLWSTVVHSGKFFLSTAQPLSPTSFFNYYSTTSYAKLGNVQCWNISINIRKENELGLYVQKQNSSHIHNLLYLPKCQKHSLPYIFAYKHWMCILLEDLKLTTGTFNDEINSDSSERNSEAQE